MVQILTVKIKLLPTKEQEVILTNMCNEYIKLINDLVSEMVKEKMLTKKTSKNINVKNLPSAVKCQAIMDAKSVFKKAKKSNYKRIPVLKKPVCIWNNQNYSFDFDNLYFPIVIHEKVKKTSFKALLVDKENRNFELLSNKLGTLRINKINGKWIAQISVTIETNENKNVSIMGVDLGIKVPAVAMTNGGKIRFFGNGREVKYTRRKYNNKRKMLGKAKKINAIRTIKNKESRWMNDVNHKISRRIVNFAKENQVSIIRLEQLTNIRKSARKSRKNNKSLYNWSFHQLSSFIVYKANLEGIKVEFINPSYTSQTCPNCGKRNKAKDRSYKCTCGFHAHRDLVGAMNIIHAPVIGGKSQSA